MESQQKLFDCDWESENIYSTRLKSPLGEALNVLKTGDMSFGRIASFKELGGAAAGGDFDAAGDANKQLKAMMGSFGI